jgi:hypothetical protein
MATVKLNSDGKVITKDGNVSCDCCGQICISGNQSDDGGGGDPSGPCRDFLTVETTPATKAGLYKCTGGVDDEGQMTWDGGSYFSPANQPSVGPCYGAHGFEFNATLNIGDTVSCQAGSWGGIYECSITCCYISAP